MKRFFQLRTEDKIDKKVPSWVCERESAHRGIDNGSMSKFRTMEVIGSIWYRGLRNLRVCRYAQMTLDVAGGLSANKKIKTNGRRQENNDIKKQTLNCLTTSGCLSCLMCCDLMACV